MRYTDELMDLSVGELARPKAVLESEGRVGEVGLERAFHICRGHFADYTQGSGLFGKYKVEVFVPEHIRGSLESGKVEKDYRVHGYDL